MKINFCYFGWVCVIAMTIETAMTQRYGSYSNSVQAGRNVMGFCGSGLRFHASRGCVDIDECAEKAPCKRDQKCRNLWGSYLCNCLAGYRMNARTGTCEDKDECAMGYCGNGQVCINTVGSFTCVCSPGTTKIGRFCRDVNECKWRPCHDSQHCINTRGSYLCKCKAGYRAARNGTCADVNECSRSMCRGLGEICQNTIGSYKCLCESGYTKDERTNGRYCVDVNECDLDQCPRNSECINTQGSYHCRCHRGFTKYRGMCVDNQECELGEGSKCQWRCQNTPGSFVCQCPKGYNRVDFACTDINECDQDGKRTCRGRGTCVNTHGSYRCIESPKCPHGNLYRKLMTTDEFGYRQITTNICRKRRCRNLAPGRSEYAQCRRLPLSVSHHYIDITSGLDAPADILRIVFPARRRRQRYHFTVSKGDRSLFGIRQPSRYTPHAYLELLRPVTGPAEYNVHVDMRTYNRRMEMRDNRMLTVLVIVSAYDF